MNAETSLKVPFVDLKIQYESLKDQMDKAMQAVIQDTAFIGGKYVTAFENAFAKEYGVKHCISCGNGTDAIYIALKALGIGAGDEVITTAMTWISTAETISQTGATPVFVDIDPDYYTMDVAKIEKKITQRTKAVIPVHLYGQPAAIEEIKKICDARGLYLIEDCAQAHFAEYRGKRVGTFGHIGTFSFYPGKNLGAYGDAGAIITNDDNLGRWMKLYANHGCVVKHQHEMPGINSRADGMQAAILSVKLPHIHTWNRKRYENALLYQKYLSGTPGIVLPKIRKDSTHIFHLYVIQTDRREELQNFLKANDVETGIHYPGALPFMKAYESLGCSTKDFPVVAGFQNRIVSLPMYPELSEEAIAKVASLIRQFAGRQ